MKSTFLLLSLISSLAIVSDLLVSEARAAVPNDFDQDGVSDVTLIETASDGSLVWRATLSSSGAASQLGTLGKDGDTPAMAQWLGNATQIGVVSASDELSDSLQWSIRGIDGAISQRGFGKKGDVVVTGGDFNGNGTADAAVVRLVDGKAVWDIAFDLFTTQEATPQQLTFGKRGDRVFFARIDDTTVDWVGVIGKGSRGRAQARFRNLKTGEIRRFNRMPKMATAGDRPRPFAIRQAFGSDLLGFQVVKNSTTTLSVFSMAGERVLLSNLTGNGSLAVGDYNEGPGYEMVFQGSESTAVVNPVLGEERELSLVSSDGPSSIVDEISVNVVGVDSSVDDSSGGSGGGGSSGGGVSQCSSILGWPGGHIYKTIGSEHFFDVRRNTIGIVVRPGGRGPFPSCAEAIDTEGNVIARLGLYERGNGWEARYYAGVGCGTDTPLNGASVAARARGNTGSSRVYMNFGGVCYGPIDASTCIGSKQC